MPVVIRSRQRRKQNQIQTAQQHRHYQEQIFQLQRAQIQKEEAYDHGHEQQGQEEIKNLKDHFRRLSVDTKTEICGRFSSVFIESAVRIGVCAGSEDAYGIVRGPVQGGDFHVVFFAGGVGDGVRQIKI